MSTAPGQQRPQTVPSGSLSARSPGTRRIDWSQNGANYCSGSKVESARGILCFRGVPLAKPHATSSDTRRRPISSALTGNAWEPRARTSSEYGASFQEAPYQHASMDSKPLAPYTVHAARSRIPADDAQLPPKNSSSVRFTDEPLHHDKHRFLTTHNSFFTGEGKEMRMNQAILALEATKRRSARERGVYR
mmetsp:Transcript_125652/g.361277  ORF Transcript_125652/g.361277 Transcript_125652/m.361277 type:complete len:191 (-) Transcript_125652:135-707(-)